KEAVVLAHAPAGNEKFLCAYVVPEDRGITAAHTPETDRVRYCAGLKSFLAERLPEYMVPAHVIAIAAIPFTPGGKIDRRALPVPETSTVDFVAPRDKDEETLVSIWADVLRMQKSKISIDADFFELGGHSLRATTVASRIHKTFDVKIPLADLFLYPTIRELSRLVRAAGENIYAEILPVEKREYYPLSPAQKRMYLLQEMDPGGVSYNMPQLFPVPAGMDKERLETILATLILRHESLRTSFVLVDDEPVQRVYDDVDFSIETAGTEAGFTRPFDLSRAPLLRAVILPASPASPSSLLLIDMHHIISDGVSQAVLEEEFARLCSDDADARGLEPLR
ncbi:MAG: hypothetical protein GY849_22190, partial [Deltaproteobacteria bacterium]|nr:hypothetical protein [Deltaproteobacteria bacterium]